jgi:prepilin-type N-terminal cleavage/methylation domain
MNQRGFTLMELLVALSLVGMMTLLLYGALGYGGRAWDRGEAAAEREAGLILLHHRLRDLFLAAGNPAAQGGTRPARRFFFSGDANGVEFVTAMGRETGGGLYLVRLEQRAGNGGRRLMLRRWLFHPEVLDGQATLPAWIPYEERGGTPKEKAVAPGAPGLWYAESVVAERLRRADFAYRGDAGGAWQDRWSGGGRLPSLVRLQVEDDQGRWPVMIFEVPRS